MENISKFLSINSDNGSGSGSGSGFGFGFGFGFGDGSGSGSGSGSGFGDGDGFGFGFGFGDGSGSGFGDGFGSGFGSGFGFGDGSGSGFGDGFGDGDGSGFGSGFGSEVVMFNNIPVYYVDGVTSIIKQIKNNIAKGFILNCDLTLTPCYIAKIENSFAHASTIKEAVRQASEKAFQELPIEKRIERFWECHNKTDKYLAHDLWI